MHQQRLVLLQRRRPLRWRRRGGVARRAVVPPAGRHRLSRRRPPAVVRWKVWSLCSVTSPSCGGEGGSTEGTRQEAQVGSELAELTEQPRCCQAGVTAGKQSGQKHAREEHRHSRSVRHHGASLTLPHRRRMRYRRSGCACGAHVAAHLSPTASLPLATCAGDVCSEYPSSPGSIMASMCSAHQAELIYGAPAAASTAACDWPVSQPPAARPTCRAHSP